MVFSSYIFLFIFLPITFCGYFYLNKIGLIKFAKLWLIFASLVFYSNGNIYHLILFVSCVIFNFIVGKKLGEFHVEFKGNLNKKYQIKTILILGISIDLIFLGYFKYKNFFFENFNHLTDSHLSILEVALPLGISFYTFQLIAYLIDSYKGITKEFSIVNYLLFITFFPQLIVGPIVHHEDVIPQFKNLKKSRINFKNIAGALFLLSIGLSKKLIIADPLTRIARNAFENVANLSFLEAWAAILSYTVSYYFDLSGYADMAVALGLMFNISLIANFNSPYKARNFADYWRRWHISLSKFLGDYIFKNIYHKGDGSFKFYFAVLFTFFISGIWHGAGWTFIVWGILNGIFVACSHYMERNNKNLPFIVAWSLTFIGILLTRLLFVSANFNEAWIVFRSMFNFFNFRIYNTPYLLIDQVIYITVGLYIAFFKPSSMEVFKKFQPNLKFLIFTILLMLFSLMQMGGIINSFLYYQF